MAWESPVHTRAPFWKTGRKRTEPAWSSGWSKLPAKGPGGTELNSPATGCAIGVWILTGQPSGQSRGGPTAMIPGKGFSCRHTPFVNSVVLFFLSNLKYLILGLVNSDKIP